MAAIIVTAIALFFTLPFMLKLTFSFNSRKKSLQARIYIYGIRVLTIRGVLADKILYSIGRNKLKSLSFKKQGNKLKHIKPKKDAVTIYAKIIIAYGKEDEPIMTSLVCAAIDKVIDVIDDRVKNFVREDVRVMPIYTNDVLCVHSEILLITNPLKIFSLFV